MSLCWTASGGTWTYSAGHTLAYTSSDGLTYAIVSHTGNASAPTILGSVVSYTPDATDATAGEVKIVVKANDGTYNSNDTIITVLIT